jgi:hypothetical protein
VELTQEAHKDLDTQPTDMLEELAEVDQVAEALAEAEREEMLQQPTRLETVDHLDHFQYLEQQQIMQEVEVEVLQVLMEAETAVLQ